MILRQLFPWLAALVFTLLFLPTSAFAQLNEDNFTPDIEVSFPYHQQFNVSAYYSPLPNQAQYVTGSYEGDIRLNGDGVNSADNTPVYFGMIAAPSSYPFGTKIELAGLGVGTVHDRGGAIVSKNQSDEPYDRLDIWMGYGDAGLQAALFWGKRVVDGRVFGVDATLSESFDLQYFSQNSFSSPSQSSLDVLPSLASAEAATDYQELQVYDDLYETLLSFERPLSKGDSGSDVRRLQEELVKLGYLRIAPTGYFGDLTEHALFKLQQFWGFVDGFDTPGAGSFGPQTRTALNQLLSQRISSKQLIALARIAIDERKMVARKEPVITDVQFFAEDLHFGDRGPEVERLQKFLQSFGFFQGLTSEYFGEKTRLAVLAFQKANEIVSDDHDVGAGRLGPETRTKVNELSYSVSVS